MEDRMRRANMSNRNLKKKILGRIKELKEKVDESFLTFLNHSEFQSE